MEVYNGVSSDNNKTSVVVNPSSMCGDPTRKKMFRITSSVKMNGSDCGDVGVDNDADSIDGLDDDLSSDFYDSSKATDLDMDLLQDCLNMHLIPDDMSSTTTIVLKQKPDQNSQSRFKVVKIETKEPFKRGKWICYDFYDTGPGSVVTVEKNGSKIEDSIIHSAVKDSLTSSTYGHYHVQDVNDSSSKIFNSTVAPVNPVSVGGDGHPVHKDYFVPIQPANQIFNQLNGLSSDGMAPFIAQQVLMSVAAVPSSSNSVHNLAQPGHTTIIQSLPHTSILPYSQEGHQVGLSQNGIPVGHSLEETNLPSQTVLAIVNNGPSNIIARATSVDNSSNIVSSQVIITACGVPCLLSQTQIGNDGIVPQGISSLAETGVSSAASIVHVPQSKTEAVVPNNLLNEDQMVLDVKDGADSIETLHGDANGHSSESLKEAVETVGDIYMGLETRVDEPDESGGSTVAIDNKIEQAMDLVKRHLMYAVREEVEILKQQIGEMVERIGQLEYENTVLRSEAKPETLNKLQQPRVTQTLQTSLSGTNITGANLQQPQQAASQSASQQVVQIPSQPQHVSQTTLSQATQPSS